MLSRSVLFAEGQDLPERSGETVRVQGQGDLCRIQTVQALRALNHILAGIVEKSETRSNYTSSLSEKRAQAGLPQKHLADSAGCNPAEGVHLELVEVGVRIVWPYVRSIKRRDKIS